MKKSRIKGIQENRGITLIALVITIIVLLILAGVSIAMLTGENGLLTKVGDAKTNTDNAQIKERVQLAYTAAIANGNGELTESNLRAELTSEFGDDYDLSEDTTTNEWVISVNEVERLRIGKGTTTPLEPKENELPTTLGTKPYFPSDKFSQLEETNLTNGLVITDKAENEEVGNEYVWIEVPNDGTGPVYTAVASEEENSDDYYTAIETALRTYCTKDASNADLITIGTNTSDCKTTTVGWKDEWYYGCGIPDSDSYKTLYRKMLKSVYENGGFWIGRYEAGTATARNYGDSASGIIPLSKIDLYSINYVTCSEAQTIASSVPNKGSYNSSLMFGIQWDLVLRHLSNKGVATSDLTLSSNWGNYRDVVYDLKEGSHYLILSDNNLSTTWKEYNEDEPGFVESSEKKSIESMGNGVLCTTGANIANNKKNIYDLAGNVGEWTLEHSNYSSLMDFPCVNRGANFQSSKIDWPASTRGWDYSNSSNYSTGFRVCIY